MKHVEIRRALYARVTTLLNGKVRLPVKPYPYQREALVAIRDWLGNPKGSRRAHLAHATGLGKTIVFSSVIAACTDMRTLVIVPNKTLVEQTARQLARFCGGEIGHVSSLKEIRDAENDAVIAVNAHGKHSLVVTTDESLRIRRDWFAKTFRPQLVIYDECHWGYTAKQQEALGMLKEAVIIGFSATPDFLTNSAKRGYVPVTLENGLVLYGPPDRFAATHFGPRLDERSLRWGIQNEWLAPLAWGRIEFKLSLDDLPLADGPGGLDYQERSLQALMARHWPSMIETICRLYGNRAYRLRKRATYSACPSVDAALTLAKALNRHGIPAATVYWETPDEERNRIFRAFKDGDIKHIASVVALREGWDVPHAEVCMMLRATRSRLLYTQILGRDTRKDPANPKKVALVLDPHFQDTTFAPLCAPVLFGEPLQQSIRDGGILIGPGHGDTGFASPYLLKRAKPRIVTFPALEIEYWAGEDGFFEADGERWGSRYAFASLFGLSDNALSLRVTSCRSCRGKASSGLPTIFYALSDMKKACADLLRKMPKSNADGFFKADGEWWGTVRALSERLGLSDNAVKRRLKAVRSRMGKDRSGNPTTFRALSDAEKACADLLKKVPKANADGFYRANGERWGTVGVLARRLGVSELSITHRKEEVRTRPGKTFNGVMAAFYALSDVEKACARLLKKVPKADAKGIFVADGERWITVSGAERLLNLSHATISTRVSTCRSRSGKDSGGHPVAFYALTDVKKACADLLKPAPKPDAQGLFRANGEWWGTARSLGRSMGVSPASIRKHLSSCRSRNGKDSGGHPVVFYALTDVKKACADLLAKKRSKKPRKPTRK